MPPRKNSNAVESLTQVVSLVKERREANFVELQSAHDATADWLAKSFQSYKRKLGGRDVSIHAASLKKTKPMPVQEEDKENAGPSSMNTSATNVPTAKPVPASEVVLKSAKTNAPKTEAVPVVLVPKKQETESPPSVVELHPSPQHDSFSTHPRYVEIMSMKVIELKKELKSLKLDGPGLKKDLQKRLLGALCENTTNSDGKTRDDDESLPKLATKSPFAATPVDDDDDDDEMEVEEVVEDKKSGDRMSFVPTDTTDQVENDDVTEETTAPEKEAVSEPVLPKVVVNKSASVARSESVVRSTAALFSPAVITSKFQEPRPHEISLQKQKPATKPNPALSPMQMIKKSISLTANNFSSSARKLMNIEAAAQPNSSDSKSVSSTSARAASAESNIPETTEATGLSSAVKISNNGGMETSMTHTLSATVKEKQKMLAEARKQRLAEMRGKSQPVPLTKSVKEIALSSNQKILQSKDDEKRTLMTAKIREKHAALKGTVPQLDSSTKLTAAASKKVSPPTRSSSRPVESVTKQPLAAVVEKQAPIKFIEQIRSPMDTYEISDREESDSDESDCSDAAQKKNIPKWAQKENLITALKDQYDEKNVRLDPDALFPEVETCDLEAIFDKKRSRYKKRTSSGNWTKDRVTAVEKLTYKRTMGYQASTR